MISILPGIQINENELRFTTSRSRGPGGQNVNKLETRVTLLFDVNASLGLDLHQRALIARHLNSRITRDHILKIDCETHRSQEANRREVVERFRELMASALRPRRRRRPTRPTRASKDARLLAKARRSDVKRTRKRIFD